MIALAEAQTHTADLDGDFERRLVSCLLIDASEYALVASIIKPSDIQDTRARILFETLGKLGDAANNAEGHVDTLMVARYMAEHGQLAAMGGPAGLGEFLNLEAVSVFARRYAAEVKRASVRRQVVEHLRHVEQEPADAENFGRLSERFAELQALEKTSWWHEHADPESIFFTGARLTELLNEPAPEPVYPGTPPAGHFSLLIAPSFSGKTSLALWVAMARVRGQAPWPGAPVREPGRVLFYSIDEPPGQVAHRIRNLAIKHPAGRFFNQYADRFTITGPHPSVDPDKLGALRFTEEGLRILEGILERAAKAGDPFTDVIVDAYSDLLPVGESDSSNEEATRIGGALERLAVTYGPAIQVIHHAGKLIAGAEPPDPRDYGRGASALAAKARAIFTLEEEPGMPNVRRIRTRTNLTASPGPFLVQVSDERASQSTRIDYFRPHDAATAFAIDAYLSVDDDWISVNQLARRIAGDNLDPDAKVPGSIYRRAKELRGIWHGAGLVEVRDGARSALELRRVR